MVEPFYNEASPNTNKAAITAGVLSGLLALALIFGIGVLVFGPQSERVPAASVAVGDCVSFAKNAGMAQQFDKYDCSDPHMAQVTALITYPDANKSTYPGSAKLLSWADNECAKPSEDFIGIEVLDTTLEASSLVPTSSDWESEIFVATCYLSSAESDNLESSIKDRGAEFERGDFTQVSRLKPGDCYDFANENEEVKDLLPSTRIRLASCEGTYQGVFFGTGKLNYDSNTQYPGEVETSSVSEQLCGELFQEHFETSASNFPYRYWEPSESSWKAGYRQVHCTILDDEPLDGPFDPNEHKAFFDIEPGECFNNGPAIQKSSPAQGQIQLETQMKIVDCAEPHVGQLVGSGSLVNDSVQYPGSVPINNEINEKCATKFLEFVGIRPSESDLQENYNYWYPDDTNWLANDKRYVCAIYQDEAQSGSYEDSKT